jgi:hypothetical protein
MAKESNRRLAARPTGPYLSDSAPRAGGGSSPPELHRLQRSKRQRAKAEPATAPLFSIATRAKVEQVGTNLQTPVALTRGRRWYRAMEPSNCLASHLALAGVGDADDGPRTSFT